MGGAWFTSEAAILSEHFGQFEPFSNGKDDE